MKRLFNDTNSPRLIQLREGEDVTFGGVAPEPSSENMIKTVTTLQNRKEIFKLGAIIDPDGDRIRFTDAKLVHVSHFIDIHRRYHKNTALISWRVCHNR